MKIKSIKLTSEREAQIVKGYVNACIPDRPIYQVEYEETTPTGLKASGSMELKGENLDEVITFFGDLERSLIKKYDENKEGQKDNATPFTKTRKAFEDSLKDLYKGSVESDMPFDDKPESDKDELLKFTTDLATCLGVDDRFVDEIKKLFK